MCHFLYVRPLGQGKPWLITAWVGHNQVFATELQEGNSESEKNSSGSHVWAQVDGVTALCGNGRHYVAVGLESGVVTVWNLATLQPEM